MNSQSAWVEVAISPNVATPALLQTMCGYTFAATADRSFSGVLPSLVVGVNDKTNRAAIGGRPQDQFIEQRFNPDDFTLKAISHTSD